MRMFVAVLAAVSLAVAADPDFSPSPDDWKNEADARIEQIRKRDVEILVVDRQGTPVPGAIVRADQSRHRFAFGSCINGNTLSNASYRDFLVSHFEWAVLENESKWFNNELQRDFVTFDKADQILEFCEENGILMRGHCIFWAKEQYTPPWCRSLPEEDLRDEVDERLDDAVNHFRGRFLHWDVNNEMLDGRFFESRLGPEIRPWMFERAHEIDPDVLLFVNDYSILAGSATRTDAYIGQIEDLRAAGAPVHAVGVQGHFWGDSVSPTQILARLDQLAVLGLPVWVTEYDAVDPDEIRRADKLENLYRSAFSHPVVEGILMWGFWAGSHWRGPDAAIVNEDWTVNAAGLRYEQLMAEWTTHVEGSTEAGGIYSFRGFHGTYVVDVAAGGSNPPPTTLEVEPGEGVATYLIPLRTGSCFPAAEVTGLRMSHARVTGVTTIAWTPLPRREDMGSLYDTIRSPDPADFANAAVCIESDGEDPHTEDPEAPPPGGLLHYLVRGSYDCPRGEGPLGLRSDGTAREAGSCP